MEKSDLIASIMKKTNLDAATAEKVINDVIAEAVSPLIFKKPGTVAGIGDTNGCRIPGSVLEQQLSESTPEVKPLFSELTGEVQKGGRTVKVIVQGVEVKE